jgi:ABC-2 type transport system permease protein
MRLENAYVIGKREYMTRIKTKGFWIATVGLPLFMAAMAVGPALLIAKTQSRHRIAVVDAVGGGLGQEIVRALSPSATAATASRRGEGAVLFDVRLTAPAADAAAQRRELDQMVRDKQVDSWLWLGPAEIERNRFDYHAASTSNWITQNVLQHAVSEAVGRWRLRRAGYDAAKIDRLTRLLEIDTFGVGATGSRAEAGMGKFFVVFGLFLMLYMILIIHGTQIMQGVIEEKSSRVIEVITSAVAPTELMAGKLGGICLLALTQLGIWLATAVLLTTPGIIGAVATMPAGALPSIPAAVLANFLVLFLLGFFLFSTLYAMIGAAFNSVQEAQQVASIAIFFVVAPMIFFMPVINDPDSRLAVVTSMIPFFTPLVMTLRVAAKMPPTWQIVVAYLGCGATVALMIWLCSRVYRVGILMYGKKPTVQEIARWVRYS